MIRGEKLVDDDENTAEDVISILTVWRQPSITDHVAVTRLAEFAAPELTVRHSLGLFIFSLLDTLNHSPVSIELAVFDSRPRAHHAAYQVAIVVGDHARDAGAPGRVG